MCREVTEFDSKIMLQPSIDRVLIFNLFSKLRCLYTCIFFLIKESTKPRVQHFVQQIKMQKRGLVPIDIINFAYPNIGF